MNRLGGPATEDEVSYEPDYWRPSLTARTASCVGPDTRPPAPGTASAWMRFVMAVGGVLCV